MSEEELNKLIWEVVSKQVNINTSVMKKIADEIRVYFALNRDSIDTTVINYAYIEKMLYSMQKDVLNDISNLTWRVSKQSYADKKYLYDSIGRTPVPFEYNNGLIEKTENIEKTARKTYAEMSNKSVILLKDKGILKPLSIKDALLNVVQRAKEQIQFGNNKIEGIRSKIIELTESGLRYVKTLGNKILFSRRQDIMLNQELALSCRDIELGVTDIVDKEINSNGVEISAHIFPAPDHEPVQGRQFTDYNFERMQSGMDCLDVNGNHYDGFARPIYGINCKHFVTPIIVGLTPPKYSDEQLQRIINNNHKGYTLKNGKHKTMYECTQIQRRLEAEIRKIKTSVMIAQKVGDIVLVKKLKTELAQKIANYYLFSQQAGLPSHDERLEIT